jgi:sugar/nucleoside kinase (ribokinase family)
MPGKNIAQQAGYVEVGEGVQIYYESHGEGNPLVFIHAWSLSTRLWKSRYEDLEIEDRDGGGDGFSSGLAFGFLSGLPPQEIVEFAVAHGALLQSTRGDTSQVSLQEVMHVAKGGSARIRR